MAPVPGDPALIGFVITLFSYPEGFRSLATIGYVLVYSYSIGIPSVYLVIQAGKRLDRHYSWLQRPFRKLLLSILVQILIVLLVVVLVKLVFMVCTGTSSKTCSSNSSDGSPSGR
ncbi:MAG: hypothetical protein R2751_17430 [Bacteroidales bacterium]